MSALDIWIQIERENEQRQKREHWFSLTDEQRDDERRLILYGMDAHGYYRRLAIRLITRTQWEGLFPLSDEERQSVPKRYMAGTPGEGLSTEQIRENDIRTGMWETEAIVQRLLLESVGRDELFAALTARVSAGTITEARSAAALALYDGRQP